MTNNCFWMNTHATEAVGVPPSAKPPTLVLAGGAPNENPTVLEAAGVEVIPWPNPKPLVAIDVVAGALK